MDFNEKDFKDVLKFFNDWTGGISKVVKKLKDDYAAKNSEEFSKDLGSIFSQNYTFYTNVKKASKDFDDFSKNFGYAAYHFKQSSDEINKRIIDNFVVDVSKFFGPLGVISTLQVQFHMSLDSIGGIKKLISEINKWTFQFPKTQNDKLTEHLENIQYGNIMKDLSKYSSAQDIPQQHKQKYEKMLKDQSKKYTDEFNKAEKDLQNIKLSSALIPTKQQALKLDKAQNDFNRLQQKIQAITELQRTLFGEQATTEQSNGTSYGNNVANGDTWEYHSPTNIIRRSVTKSTYKNNQSATGTEQPSTTQNTSFNKSLLKGIGVIFSPLIKYAKNWNNLWHTFKDYLKESLMFKFLSLLFKGVSSTTSFLGNLLAPIAVPLATKILSPIKSLFGKLFSTPEGAVQSAADTTTAMGSLMGFFASLIKSWQVVHTAMNPNLSQEQKIGYSLAGNNSNGSGDTVSTMNRVLSGAATGAGIGAGIGSIFPGIGTIAGAALGAGIGGLLAYIGGERIAKQLAQVTKSFQNSMNDLNKIVTVGWKDISTTFNNSMNDLNKIVTVGWKDISTTFNNSMSDIGKIVTVGWKDISGAFNNSMSMIDIAMSKGWDSLYSGFKTSMSGINTIVSNGLKPIGDLFVNLFNSIIKNITHPVTSTVSNIWNFITGKKTTNSQSSQKPITDYLKASMPSLIPAQITPQSNSTTIPNALNITKPSSNAPSQLSTPSFQSSSNTQPNNMRFNTITPYASPSNIYEWKVNAYSGMLNQIHSMTPQDISANYQKIQMEINAVNNAQGIKTKGFASGGLVNGNGSPTSDNIQAKLSPGEYVIPANVASKNSELIQQLEQARTSSSTDVLSKISLAGYFTPILNKIFKPIVNSFNYVSGVSFWGSLKDYVKNIISTNANDIFNAIQDTSTKFLSPIQNSFSTLKDKLIDDINTTVTKVTKDIFSGNIKDIGKTLVLGVKNMFSDLSSGGNNIFQSIKKGLSDAFGPKISDAFSGVMGNVSKTISPIISSISKVAVPALATAGKGVISFFSGISSAIPGIGIAISQALDILPQLPQLWDAIKKTQVGKALSPMVDSIGKVFGSIGNLISTIVNNPIFKLSMDALMLPMKLFIDDISNFFNMISNAINFISNIIKSLINVVTNNPIVKMISGVVNAVGGVISGIANFISHPFGLANGGLVLGSGGPKEDNISAKLSSGEYVIPANIVKSNPDLIKSIEGTRVSSSNKNIKLQFQNGGEVKNNHIPDILSSNPMITALQSQQTSLTQTLSSLFNKQPKKSEEYKQPNVNAISSNNNSSVVNMNNNSHLFGDLGV